MNHTTLEDLLMDESFLAWYYHSDEAQEDKWNRWIAASPENQLLAEQATQWLSHLHAVQGAVEPNILPSEADEVWAGIADAIQKKERSACAVTRAAFKLPIPSTPRSFLIGSYFKIAWRHLTQSKMYSAINIFGLSMGMAVTMLIGLWIYDEITFNHYYKNHDRIASVITRYSANGQVGLSVMAPPVLGAALRASYGSNFAHVVMASGDAQHNVSAGDKKFSRNGNFMEPDAPDMLSLKMERGDRNGLKDPHSILLSSSLAKGLFGDADPLGKIVKIDNRVPVKVTGVYEDIPADCDFNNLAYLAPWDLFVSDWQWVHDIKDSWDFTTFRTYVQLAPHADFGKVSDQISDLRKSHLAKNEPASVKLFLFPMNRWHLYSGFENGELVGGQIKYVWLFGTIGVFVLLLACINFMNLSTARSEKRAKEVGIRKAIGSVRGQLIGQFLSESVLVTLISFAFSLVLVQLTLPLFNAIAHKEMTVLWTNPWFWIMGLGCTLLTGLIAGSYPAFYLSSFRPVKVLKGTFRVGRFAALPRKVLVVVQFSVSVLLIAGTVIVFRQIQFAKDRPVGYDRNGLISIIMTTTDIYHNYDAIRNELLTTRAAAAVSESQGPLTDVWTGTGGIEWKGMRPGSDDNFSIVGGTMGYGKTVGWQMQEGRDFSPEFATDTTGLVLNEAAVKFMGLQHPVGQTIWWGKKPFKILGVVKNIVMTSPYEPVRQTLFYLLTSPGNFVNIRINPHLPIAEALTRVGATLQKYNPAAPFEYQFADADYAKKFGDEERIGKLAAVFANLAILISCLGLFGLASFMAEQRSKEVGIRKVLGATIFNLWKLLSKDFVTLVLLSCFIAIPVAWYFLDKWLQQYNYRTKITWDIFALVGGGALGIALLTVSYQAIKTALANPVIALKNNE